MEISKSGLVQINGKLGDGTKITNSARMTNDLSFVGYIPLYHQKGLLSGVLVYDSTQQAFTGDLHWFKPSDTGPIFRRKYPAGFSIDLTTLGVLK